MKKRIGNDISFVWHIYRKSGEEQVPESFTGKDVTIKLISPLQRPVTIEDVSIATGVVTFTFKGKYQTTLGNYVAVLQENKGEDGMVTLDVVDAVSLVPHSYMEEDGDEGDVIEATSVELDSEIGQGIDAYTKAESDELFVKKIFDEPGVGTTYFSPTGMSILAFDEHGVMRQTSSYGALGWSVYDGTDYIQTFGGTIYKGGIGTPNSTRVVWEKTATQQIPTATTEDNGLMSAADKGKLDALPTNEQLTQELAGKQDTINDLAAIRSGAQAGATAVQPSALAPVAISGSYNSLSDKPDLSVFITKSVNDLTYYYLKSETYTKNEVQQLIGAIQQFHYEVYPTLPQTGASNVLYLIGPTGTGADKYEEYVYANNEWTKIGDTSIDLSGYVTTQALNTALAGYVTSSALSTALANYYNKTEVDGLFAGKDDITSIVTPVNATDETLPITTLACEVGKYYRIDVAVDTLAITLPAMTDLTAVKTVVIYLTGGTTPAITISSSDSKDVYYQDGFEIEAGNTYEINALFNGAAWVVAAVKINVE